jgi:NADH-quinone oxidoreductase subunit G
VWHRKASWKLHALDPKLNARIERVTPRENAEVNGPWICNKARDLAQLLDRPRATEPMREGRAVSADDAIAAASALLAQARHAVVLVSSWGSNEELAACKALIEQLGGRAQGLVKADHTPVGGEIVSDDVLIMADKNPNRRGALAHFAAFDGVIAEDVDVVLVWGEGVDSALLPSAAKVIRCDAYAHEANHRADVFLPLSLHTERDGHFTNHAGVVSAFAKCFDAAPSVQHAEGLFAALRPAMVGAGR